MDIQNDNKYLTLFEYIDIVKKAVELYHVNDDEQPIYDELILLYICHIFEDVYYNDADKLYLIDIYIINRIYNKLVLFITDENNKENIKDNKLWFEFWESSASEIIKCTTQTELNDLIKWFDSLEEIILNIVSNKKRFDYITKYNKKFTNILFHKYINVYLKYYIDFNNINIDNEDE